MCSRGKRQRPGTMNIRETSIPLGGMFLDLKRRYLTTKYCGARRRASERMFEISPLFLAGKLGKRRVKQITNWCDGEKPEFFRTEKRRKTDCVRAQKNLSIL